jgi:hypothetical protein
MAVDKDLIDSLVNGFGVERSQVELSTDLIDVVLQKYIKKWQDNLTKNNHRATDNLWQSLGSDKGAYGFKVEKTGQGITRIVLMLPDYYEYTDTGRDKTEKGSKPGKLRPKIQEWIKFKGLVGRSGKTITGTYKLKDGTIKTYTRKLTAAQWNKQLSFLIARKIHKKGFNGTNWFSSEITGFTAEIKTAIFELTGQVAQVAFQKIV